MLIGDRCNFKSEWVSKYSKTIISNSKRDKIYKVKMKDQDASIQNYSLLR